MRKKYKYAEFLKKDKKKQYLHHKIVIVFTSPRVQLDKTATTFNNPIMDWDSAKQHCTERNWQWSLELIRQAKKEMEELETKLKRCEDQQKANRLYNACNF